MDDTLFLIKEKKKSAGGGLQEWYYQGTGVLDKKALMA